MLCVGQHVADLEETVVVDGLSQDLVDLGTDSIVLTGIDHPGAFEGQQQDVDVHLLSVTERA